MLLIGRTFSACIHGSFEIVNLPKNNQIAVQLPNGNSFVIDNQIIEAIPVAK